VESIRHGVRHIGYWVDDVTAEAKRLGALGYPSFATAGHAPQLPAQLSRDLWRSFFSVAGQDGVELVAGADVELGEDLVQVVFDGARAHE
jgi:hypothetical protein